MQIIDAEHDSIEITETHEIIKCCGKQYSLNYSNSEHVKRNICHNYFCCCISFFTSPCRNINWQEHPFLLNLFFYIFITYFSFFLISLLMAGSLAIINEKPFREYFVPLSQIIFTFLTCIHVGHMLFLMIIYGIEFIRRRSFVIPRIASQLR